jgi:hypothetical protein
MATCRECKLFDIESAKDKRGYVRKDRAVKCLWVSREQYPASVYALSSRPHATYTCSDKGKGCKCFQKRLEATP